jgi:hypothetical protein
MAKLDLKQTLKQLYSPSAKEPAIVDVPPLNFLMVDGAGDPNSAPEFAEAMGALYTVAYTLKFRLKKADPPVEYVVMPPEGLWWAEDMSEFALDRKDAWQWTLMIAQPEDVTEALVAEAVAEAARKKELPGLPNLRLDRFHEGLSAQIMHLGPYAAEAPTISRLHDFIRESGHTLRGKHHEIYLSDPRRAAPEKLRTVIRQPIA